MNSACEHRSSRECLQRSNRTRNLCSEVAGSWQRQRFPPMPCLSTFRVSIAILATFALTAVLPRVSTVPRGCGPPVPSAASSAAGFADPVCKYGTQPYYFLPAKPAQPWNVTPKNWDLRAFDARCQPRPLVDRLLDAKKGANSSRQLSIILYGDR